MKKIPTKLIEEGELDLYVDSTEVDNKPVGSQNPKDIDNTSAVKAEGGEKTPDSKEDVSVLKSKDGGDVNTIAKGPQDAPEVSTAETKKPVKAETGDSSVKEGQEGALEVSGNGEVDKKPVGSQDPKMVESYKFVIYEGLPRLVIKEGDGKFELLYDADDEETKEVKAEECSEYKPNMKEEDEDKKEDKSEKKEEADEETPKEDKKVEEEGTELEADDDVKVNESIIKKGQKILVLKEGISKKGEKLINKEVEFGDKILEKGDRYIIVEAEDEEKKDDGKEVKEELTDKQKQLDVDGDGKIEGEDLAKLRAGKKAEETKDDAEDEKEDKKEKQAEKVLYIDGKKYILSESEEDENKEEIKEEDKETDKTEEPETKKEEKVKKFPSKGRSKISVDRITEEGEEASQDEPEGTKTDISEEENSEENKSSEKKEEAEGDEEDKKEDEKEKAEESILVTEDVELVTEAGKIILEKGDRFIVLKEEDIGTAPFDKKEAEIWKDPLEVKEEMPDVPEKIKEDEEEIPTEEKKEEEAPEDLTKVDAIDTEDDKKDSSASSVAESKKSKKK